MKDRTITVAQIMSTPVITVSPSDTMDEVQAIFRKNNIHHIPVVEQEKVVGIISQSDYLRLQHGFTLFKTRHSETYNDAIMRSLLVGEVMTRQVATLAPDDSLEMAAGFFRENLFHALPVVDKGRLIGILTTYDMLTYAYSAPFLIEDR
ncbi:CBS domain-containing protein [Phaeodactylibacter luteus]|uniref:CBS domain-containing protein n=1 Tax=Phaeodactylibacter luteus TaxID=1564516 RepID=A0A5C6RWJ6_9BACT|nr:CBS domain-containing protein [Phaeodactylibacter luteus]TXB66325.1 CBS domain-containing protein [Phaeodactylibacter luteus]